MTLDNQRLGLRSRGSADPKAGGQNALAFHTVNAGPDGAPLRSKYLHHATKGTKSKTSGNSGKVGRRAIARMRGHGGGQESLEQKRAREAQSTAAQKARALWSGSIEAPPPGK